MIVPQVARLFPFASTVVAWLDASSRPTQFACTAALGLGLWAEVYATLKFLRWWREKELEDADRAGE